MNARFRLLLYDALNGHVLSASVVTSVRTSLRQLVRSFLQACASYNVGPLVFYKRALLTTSVRQLVSSCVFIVRSYARVHSTPRVFALFGNYIYSINI